MMAWPGVSIEAQHEARLLLAANPALFALLTIGRFIGPMRRVPRLGWVVTDPRAARQLLLDSAHTSLSGEGGVGHLWSQILGDWVTDAFDGPGHAELRKSGKDLFTDSSARIHVTRVFREPADRLAGQLRHGDTVNIAETVRGWVGRMVADLLGLEIANEAEDAPFREIFACGERLATLARSSIGSTYVKPEVVAEGKRIVEQLTAGVPRAYEEADAHTLLGRCREAGIPLREARGIASILLVAGTETSASAMARGIALLHDTGQQHLLLERPELLPSAVREILRVSTPAPLIGRHVEDDIAVGGRTLRRGDRVVMLTYTANNAVGPFDIQRAMDPSTFQLWFGAGPHLCLGAPLARAEITLLLETLLSAGRPWKVVHRRAARRVIIPSYEELLIQYEPVRAEGSSDRSLAATGSVRARA
jgi:cytochrome P450